MFCWDDRVWAEFDIVKDTYDLFIDGRILWNLHIKVSTSKPASE